VTVCLNTNGLCSESFHCAKSTLEKLENGVAIVLLGMKVLVLQPFLVNMLEPIWYNEGEGKETPLFFIVPRKNVNNHIFFSLLVNDLIIISN
jgi:hypothetical protein